MKEDSTRRVWLAAAAVALGVLVGVVLVAGSDYETTSIVLDIARIALIVIAVLAVVRLVRRTVQK
jgi:hypothetical protein